MKAVKQHRKETNQNIPFRTKNILTIPRRIELFEVRLSQSENKRGELKEKP